VFYKDYYIKVKLIYNIIYIFWDIIKKKIKKKKSIGFFSIKAVKSKIGEM